MDNRLAAVWNLDAKEFGVLVPHRTKEVVLPFIC